MPPRNILFLKGIYGRAGGSETLLAAVLNNLDRPSFLPLLVLMRAPHGNDTSILTCDRPRTARQDIVWRGISTAPVTARTLGRISREHNVALLHTHDMRANLVAYLLTRARKLPWVAHVHGWLGPTHSGRWRLYEAVEKRLIRYADLVLVGSHAAKTEVATLKVKEVQVIPNAIETPSLHLVQEQAAQVRTRLGIPPSTLIVGTLGRVHPGKGQAVLIRALAQLKTFGVNIHGLIVGEGPDLQPLRQLVQKLGLSQRVTFTGFCSDAYPYLAAMDIFVAPSLKESLPLTVLEAMALRRPVIVSRVGDLPAVITPGEHGILVPPGDVAALREAISSLTQDGELRRRLGLRACSLILHQFSAAGMTRALEAVYDEVLAKKERGRV